MTVNILVRPEKFENGPSLVTSARLNRQTIPASDRKAAISRVTPVPFFQATGSSSVNLMTRKIALPLTQQLMASSVTAQITAYCVLEWWLFAEQVRYRFLSTFNMYILDIMKAEIKTKTHPAKSETKSLHLQILSVVQENIVSRKWPPGFRIPFETDMAKEYGCSRMTVNKVLTQLTQSGLLIRNRKSGTFVRAPLSLSAVLEITNIRSEVQASGKEYSYELLSDTIRDLKLEDKSHFASDAIKKVRELKCLHSSNGQPFCFEERIINMNAVPEVKDVSFNSDAPGNWLLQWVPWNSAEHQIIAKAASTQIAKALNIKTGDACLVIERKTQNEKGYVTWARLSYPGDQHRLVAHFTPAR